MPRKQANKEWVRPVTAKDLFDVSTATLRKWAKAGQIEVKYFNNMPSKNGIRYNANSIRKNLVQ
jgi:predicted site-specific integrase-resolvase